MAAKPRTKAEFKRTRRIAIQRASIGAPWRRSRRGSPSTTAAAGSRRPSRSRLKCWLHAERAWGRQVKWWPGCAAREWQRRSFSGRGGRGASCGSDKERQELRCQLVPGKDAQELRLFFRAEKRSGKCGGTISCRSSL